MHVDITTIRQTVDAGAAAVEIFHDNRRYYLELSATIRRDWQNYRTIAALAGTRKIAKVLADLYRDVADVHSRYAQDYATTASRHNEQVSADIPARPRGRPAYLKTTTRDLTTIEELKADWYKLAGAAEEYTQAASGAYAIMLTAPDAMTRRSAAADADMYTRVGRLYSEAVTTIDQILYTIERSLID